MNKCSTEFYDIQFISENWLLDYSVYKGLKNYSDTTERLNSFPTIKFIFSFDKGDIKKPAYQSDKGLRSTGIC